jgi:hypothetical protein
LQFSLGIGKKKQAFTINHIISINSPVRCKLYGNIFIRKDTLKVQRYLPPPQQSKFSSFIYLFLKTFWVWTPKSDELILSCTLAEFVLSTKYFCEGRQCIWMMYLVCVTGGVSD